MISKNPVIEIENISKIFRDNGEKFYALKDVSFSVYEGEIFGLLGPNGSGKTTLLNIIMNIVDPDNGKVKILGKDPRKNRAIMESVNFVSGDVRFHWTLTVKDILNFYAMIYNLTKNEREKRIEELVEYFNINHLLKRRFYTLSTGESMRVTLVKSLLNNPKVILMDEPTLGLDPEIAKKVRKEIKKLNKKFKTTILLTSHYMNEVEELANRIAFLYKGKIIDIGAIEEVKKKRFDNYEVTITISRIKNPKALLDYGFKIKGNKVYKMISNDENLNEVIKFLKSNGLEIKYIEKHKPTLEDYFIKMLKETGEEE